MFDCLHVLKWKLLAGCIILTACTFKKIRGCPVYNIIQQLFSFLAANTLFSVVITCLIIEIVIDGITDQWQALILMKIGNWFV